MGNLRPSAIVSTLLAAILIAILLGFQSPTARLAATTPVAVAAAPTGSGTPAPAAGHGTSKGHGAAPGKADPVVQRGQQVYIQYCATCHGDSGKGDGIS